MSFNTIQHWVDQSVEVWQLFGYLNIFVCTFLLLVLGYLRGWSRWDWTLLVTAFVFGSGLGTMVLPSIMGALLGGLVLYLIVKHLIRFEHSAADIFTLYMIVFIGVGRLGCLFSGCCFGSVTHVPWAIQYGTGNLAHWLHFHTGQITGLNDPSLPIHPVQLYESIFLLFFTLPVVLIAQHRNVSGRIILTGFLGLYFLQRFVLEFFRDMSNVWWSEVDYGPISAFQLFLLFISLSCFSYLLYSVRTTWVVRVPTRPKRALSPQTHILVLANILVGTAMFSNHFQKIQVVVLIVLLGGSILAQLALYHSVQKRWELRLSPLIMGGLSLVLLFNTNTFFSGSTQDKTPVIPKSTWLYGINESNQKLIRLGNQNLNFSDYVRVKQLLNNQEDDVFVDSTSHQKAMRDLATPRISYAVGGSYTAFQYQRKGCGGEIVTEKVESSSMMAVVNHERSRGQRLATYVNGRLEYSTGTLRADNENDSARGFSYAYGVINTGMEAELIGLGIGVGIGANRSLNILESPIIPSAYLRFGPREFHLEAGLNDRYYMEPGFANFHLNLGHKSTRGIGYQLGVGNRGPLLLPTMGTFATVTNLQIGNLPQMDLSFHIFGESNGYATTVMFRFPPQTKTGY